MPGVTFPLVKQARKETIPARKQPVAGQGFHRTGQTRREEPPEGWMILRPSGVAATREQGPDPRCTALRYVSWCWTSEDFLRVMEFDSRLLQTAFWWPRVNRPMSRRLGLH
ncbi:unnamed protein product [Boreogadus saida]